MKSSVDTRQAPDLLNPGTAQTVPVLEETFAVAKHRVAGGDVRVAISTDTVEEIARATLRHGDVEIIRVPVGRIVDRTPEVRTEGDTTIFPVMEEVVVVETRLVLKEELRVRQTVRTEHVEQPVVLRRQSATVEHFDPEGRPAPGPKQEE